MPFPEDLTVFVDPAVFGTIATLQGGSTVNVLFDEEYLESFGITGTDPKCLAIATDVVVGNIGQTLTISGTAYTIRNRKKQGDGAFVLLELQAP